MCKIRQGVRGCRCNQNDVGFLPTRDVDNPRGAAIVFRKGCITRLASKCRKRPWMKKCRRALGHQWEHGYAGLDQLAADVSSPIGGYASGGTEGDELDYE